MALRLWQGNLEAFAAQVARDEQVYLVDSVTGELTTAHWSQCRECPADEAATLLVFREQPGQPSNGDRAAIEAGVAVAALLKAAWKAAP